MSIKFSLIPWLYFNNLGEIFKIYFQLSLVPKMMSFSRLDEDETYILII